MLKEQVSDTEPWTEEGSKTRISNPSLVGRFSITL